MALKNWVNLERLAKFVQVPIDRNKPRESRLKVALAYDKKGNVNAGIEAMTGVPLHEEDKKDLLRWNLAKPEYKNPEEFYKGFPNVDG